MKLTKNKQQMNKIEVQESVYLFFIIYYFSNFGSHKWSKRDKSCLVAGEKLPATLCWFRNIFGKSKNLGGVLGGSS